MPLTNTSPPGKRLNVGPDGTFYDDNGKPLGKWDPSKVAGTYTPPPGPTAGPSAGGDGTLAGFTQPPPNINLPNFQTPAPFTPTTAADLTSDPSYLWRVNEGERGLEAAAASRGVLNSGGTLKDIVNYGQNAASQEFQNVDSRRRNDYQQNFSDQYSTPFQFGLQRAGMQGSFDFNAWLQQYQIFRNHALDSANINAATA